MAKSIKLSKKNRMVLSTYVRLKEIKARKAELYDSRAYLPSGVFKNKITKYNAYIKEIQNIELEF